MRHPTFSRASTLRGVVETIAVYPVKAAPDGPLERIASRIEADGFTLQDSASWDLAARRGLDSVFVGLGSRERGLAARWKAKSLVPGRTRELHREVTQTIGEVLGEPTEILAGEPPR